MLLGARQHSLDAGRRLAPPDPQRRTTCPITGSTLNDRQRGTGVREGPGGHFVGSNGLGERADSWVTRDRSAGLEAWRGAACVAVGHTILGIICAVLATGQPIHDLVPRYFDDRDRQRVRRRIGR
jgi:hypothetical protein